MSRTKASGSVSLTRSLVNQYKSQRQDLRDYLWLFRKWHRILWKYPERAHAYKRREPKRSEIGGTSWLKRGPVKQHPASHVGGRP